MTEIVVTDEMRRAVYADECKVNGHRFEIIVTLDSLDPSSLICGPLRQGLAGVGMTDTNLNETAQPIEREK